MLVHLSVTDSLIIYTVEFATVEYEIPCGMLYTA